MPRANRYYLPGCIWHITENLKRDMNWSESLAVGSESFIESAKRQLDIRTTHRTVSEEGPEFILKESKASYSTHFEPKIEPLSPKNTLPWELTA